jgi:hypothetical protein
MAAAGKEPTPLHVAGFEDENEAPNRNEAHQMKGFPRLAYLISGGYLVSGSK